MRRKDVLSLFDERVWIDDNGQLLDHPPTFLRSSDGTFPSCDLSQVMVIAERTDGKIAHIVSCHEELARLRREEQVILIIGEGQQLARGGARKTITLGGDYPLLFEHVYACAQTHEVHPKQWDVPIGLHMALAPTKPEETYAIMGIRDQNYLFQVRLFPSKPEAISLLSEFLKVQEYRVCAQLALPVFKKSVLPEKSHEFKVELDRSTSYWLLYWYCVYSHEKGQLF